MIRESTIEYFDDGSWRKLDPIASRYVAQDLWEFTYAVEDVPTAEVLPAPRFRIDGRESVHAFVAFAEPDFVVMRVRL